MGAVRHSLNKLRMHHFCYQLRQREPTFVMRTQTPGHSWPGMPSVSNRTRKLMTVVSTNCDCMKITHSLTKYLNICAVVRPETADLQSLTPPARGDPLLRLRLMCVKKRNQSRGLRKRIIVVTEEEGTSLIIMCSSSCGGSRS